MLPFVVGGPDAREPTNAIRESGWVDGVVVFQFCVQTRTLGMLLSIGITFLQRVMKGGGIGCVKLVECGRRGADGWSSGGNGW